MGRSSSQHTLSKHGPAVLTALMVLCVLYASSRYSFLVFHDLVELATALVALLVFALAWNTRHVQDNRYLLFIGIASLSSGILILAHSLATTGISMFPAPDVDRAMQFWIAYRYLLGISFLLAPLFIRRRLHTGLTIGVYSLFTIVLIHAVVTGWFPHCYIAGVGMTPFKIGSEYAVAVVLVIALVLLYRARDSFSPGVLLLLSGSIAASLLCSLSYTRYVSEIGPATVAGHFFELLATYLIYRAIVVTGVADPSSLLFRDLKQSEERLRNSEERYRSLVELSPDAIVVHCEWKVVYSNSAGKRLFGSVGTGDIIGRDILEFVHPDDREAVRTRVRRSDMNRDPTPVQAIRLLRDDGRPTYVETTFVPTMHEGKPASQIIFRDITQRKLAEEELRTHRDQLGRLVEERTAELRKINDELEEEISERKASEERIRVTNDLLHLFTRTYSLSEYLDDVVALIRSWCGCSRVAIRINDDSGRHYTSAAGFDPDYLASEFMASFSAFQGAKTEMGLHSLAVIPVQYRKHVLGAIHLADTREGMVPLKIVEFVEKLSYIIGEAIYRFGIERDLRVNYEALLASEMRYRSLVDGVRDIIFTIKKDGTIVSISPAFTDSTGWKQEEWIGRHFTGLVHPDDVPAAESIFRMIVDGKPMSLFELRARLRTGDYRNFEFKVSTGYTSEGLILGSARDVTDRKQAEERLSLFVNLINQSQDAVYVVDARTSAILELNEAACTSTGYSRDQLLQMKVTDLAEGQVDIDQWTEHVAAVREKGFQLVEDTMKRRDGSTFPIEVGVKYIVHQSRDYLVAMIRDISQRKQAEEDHARLASAVEATVEAVVITDSSSGRIQYVNSAFELLTGYTRAEVLGRTLHLFESGKQDADYYTGIREALAQHGRWSGNLVNRRKNGDLYFEDCTVSPVRNRNGQIINYVYLKRDVTEKLRLESIAESVSTMDNIASVFAGVRHEIGNPVNSINMILGILRAKLDSLPNETVRDYLVQMTEQIGRVEYLLRSLKNFNLYETQNSQNVDMGQFMENFLPLVRDDFEKKGIAIETELEPGVKAYADPRALQQTLLNIFTNAADAVNGRQRPNITVTVTRTDEGVRVRVHDNGSGIPLQKLKDIFKPFYTTKQNGTGLGLVIVKKMLVRMNGTIDIESAVDSGTVVTVVIPGGTDEEP